MYTIDIEHRYLFSIKLGTVEQKKNVSIHLYGFAVKNFATSVKYINYE